MSGGQAAVHECGHRPADDGFTRIGASFVVPLSTTQRRGSAWKPWTSDVDVCLHQDLKRSHGWSSSRGDHASNRRRRERGLVLLLELQMARYMGDRPASASMVSGDAELLVAFARHGWGYAPEDQ